MARVLIVGCGCRGRELAAALAADGHAVRGTSRTEEGRAAIEAAGAEGVIADPDRLATVMGHIEGVSLVCWHLAAVDEPALHGPRLESMLEALVDTHVRGFLYEGGPGADIVRRAGEHFHMPVEVAGGGAGQMRAAVARLLTA